MAPIEDLYVATDKFRYSQMNQPTVLHPIFKRSTQRDVRFSDSSFDLLNFKAITGVRIGIRKMDKMFDLKYYRALPANLDSLTAKNKVRQSYEMRLTKLGMVNCDRFLRDDFVGVEKIQLTINLDTLDPKALSFALAFTDLNCIMPAVLQKDGKLRTGPVPVGKSAKLIAFTNDGKNLLAEVREFVVRELEVGLDLAVTTALELRKQMSEL